MLGESRKEAIGRLVRENQGRLQRSDFLDGLSLAVGSAIRPSQLLSLKATDNVRTALSTGYAAAVNGQPDTGHGFFSRDESLSALGIPLLLSRSLPEENAFLWVKQSAWCGAVAITTGKVLGACEGIRAFDGDAVSLLSEDHTQGIIFDRHDDFVQNFEASVWGSRWLAAASSLGIG
ncbi:hypothetical protein [Granulicella tundricola]|uniref:Uncharacterized protein n=1 Tax=Granulicella tundricola (strain ATCC BAA-1859 / DSM 23138 / MP5ACTX9) TaxID=1198114 RepID=E8X7V9_GRATM|nr:hypothetical protein [Granulicella tundricola]ADW71543.1 hypothetical protein AciX9_4613 [Granulicella tundricola MP5ACTX9]